MAAIVHLDTHIIVWIAMQEHDRFPSSIISRIETADLMIAPIVILELQYLVETKRIQGNPLKIIENLQTAMGLEICKDPFEQLIKESLSLSWTRDPFDRLIVAQASLARAILLTKDQNILRHYPRAVWE